jgi:hypothetical protein
MLKATPSLPAASRVETCPPVEPYFSDRPQRSRSVVETRLALVLDAHRLCQRPLDRRLRPGGVPRRATRRGERRCWLPGERASRR